MAFNELPDLNQCRPFAYDRESTDHGSKIGGAVPRDVKPLYVDVNQKYFGTIEFETGRAVSLFYSFDIYGDDETLDIISFNNRVLFPSKLIHAVVHQGSMSDGASEIITVVSCQRIRFEPMQSDRMPDSPEQVSPRSKVGGRPCIDNVSRVGPAFEELEQSGYRQLFQFDTPDPRSEAYIDGFPWDPGWLHVFVRGEHLAEAEFAFVVQQ